MHLRRGKMHITYTVTRIKLSGCDSHKLQSVDTWLVLAKSVMCAHSSLNLIASGRGNGLHVLWEPLEAAMSQKVSARYYSCNCTELLGLQCALHIEPSECTYMHIYLVPGEKFGSKSY